MSTLAHLRTLLEDATADLLDVTHRRMFGCDGFFADGRIFGLIWKDGRIGLRYSEDSTFKRAMALDGAEPWTIGKMTMSKWVLMPEAFHDEPESLERWARRAHSETMALGVEAEEDTPSENAKRGPSKATSAPPALQKAKGGSKTVVSPPRAEDKTGRTKPPSKAVPKATPTAPAKKPAVQPASKKAEPNKPAKKGTAKASATKKQARGR
jgi:TfoX/Sxy family transcriptional regulator of competence genes